jgi:hypothetical protein
MAEQGVPVDSRPAVVFSVAPALNEAILETLRIGRTVSVFLPILDMGLLVLFACSHLLCMRVLVRLVQVTACIKPFVVSEKL